ncbi:thiosulfate/3-mercaptopyruvate sulfurtransferase [Anaerosolibacter carboniphilus]|uniref:Thiosulfate/3-mercaptopyruvate sulfurtransferase n=1 Tax=Anaerosolibacter carboniphilus TaxID=1417629 RepID=A0A841KQ94_9FIRM|nr:rhodanese-like domain-containing protein [Anaerosolibacter carboniphilus]MBB6215511.1 thiosulfate/3-mercaptopyruvate sulfurtransferase [Anaerosolibacter carboniphilus]
MKNKKNYLALFLVVLFSIFIFTACSKNTKTENVNATEGQEVGEASAISTEELKQNIGKEDWVVVDTRINDAFNGWQLDGVKRGGHIKGATDFAAAWLKVSDPDKEEKLEKILSDKGIIAEKNIVLYDANGNDAKELADYLASKGYKNLYAYNVKEWASDDNLPMESYPNYSMLVPATWINDLIKSNNNGLPYKVFEVSWGEVSEEYNKGHIPSAVHINTDEVEEGPIWNRKSADQLEQFALNNGITTDTTTVLYGSDTMAASRVAVILKYMGVKDVRILNGGYSAWVNAGYNVETTVNKKTPVDAFGTTVPANPNYIVDLPTAKEILADKEKSILVDIRSWDEYIGKTSGYDYITGKGRPSGSKWGHDIMDYKNIDTTMRNADEIIDMWKEWNITTDQRLSFFCGTGWRAAEVLLYADVMGLQNISLYDGGWNEWSSDAQNPIETGEPNNK